MLGVGTLGIWLSDEVELQMSAPHRSLLAIPQFASLWIKPEPISEFKGRITLQCCGDLFPITSDQYRYAQLTDGPQYANQRKNNESSVVDSMKAELRVAEAEDCRWRLPEHYRCRQRWPIKLVGSA